MTATMLQNIVVQLIMMTMVAMMMLMMMVMVMTRMRRRRGRGMTAAEATVDDDEFHDADDGDAGAFVDGAHDDGDIVVQQRSDTGLRRRLCGCQHLRSDDGEQPALGFFLSTHSAACDCCVQQTILCDSMQYVPTRESQRCMIMPMLAGPAPRPRRCRTRDFERSRVS